MRNYQENPSGQEKWGGKGEIIQITFDWDDLNWKVSVRYIRHGCDT